MPKEAYTNMSGTDSSTHSSSSERDRRDSSSSENSRESNTSAYSSEGLERDEVSPDELARAVKWFRWEVMYGLFWFNIALKKRKATLYQFLLLPFCLFAVWMILHIVYMPKSDSTEAAASSMPVATCYTAACTNLAYYPKGDKDAEAIVEYVRLQAGMPKSSVVGYDDVNEIIDDIYTEKKFILYTLILGDYELTKINAKAHPDLGPIQFGECFPLNIDGKNIVYEMWTMLTGYNWDSLHTFSFTVAVDNAILQYEHFKKTGKEVDAQFTLGEIDGDKAVELTPKEERKQRNLERREKELVYTVFVINLIVWVESYIGAHFYVKDKSELRHQGMTVMGVRGYEILLTWFPAEFALSVVSTVFTCALCYSLTMELFIKVSFPFMFGTILLYKMSMVAFCAPYAVLFANPRNMFVAMFLVFGSSWWLSALIITSGFSPYLWGSFGGRFTVIQFPYYMNAISLTDMLAGIVACDPERLSARMVNSIFIQNRKYECDLSEVSDLFGSRNSYYGYSSYYYYTGSTGGSGTGSIYGSTGAWSSMSGSMPNYEQDAFRRGGTTGYGSTGYSYSSTSSSVYGRNYYGGNLNPFWAPYASLMILLFPIARDVLLALYLDHVTTSPSSPGRAACFCVSNLFSGRKGGNQEHDSFEFESFEEAGSDCGLLSGGHPIGIRMYKMRKIYYKAMSGLVRCGNVDPPTVAVEGLTISASQGSVLGILGQNGAGKTSAFNVLTGVVRADEGITVVGGFDVNSSMYNIRPLLGVCPQHDTLYHALTPRDHLNLYATIRGVQPADVEGVVREHLETVNLTAVADDKVGTFSGGMRRRVAIACSTIGNPPFILLDEPTSGLDPVNRQCVWEIVNKVKKKSVVLLITHSMEEAELLSDRLAIMVKGRLAALGDPLKMKARFSAGYNISLVCKHGEEETVERAVLAFARYARVTSRVAGSVKLAVPRNSGSDIPALLQFAEDEIAKNNAGIVTDWSLSFATLEEVFRAVTEGEAQRLSTLVMEEDPSHRRRRRSADANATQALTARFDRETFRLVPFEGKTEEKEYFCELVDGFDCDRDLIEHLIRFYNTAVDEDGTNPLFFDFNEFQTVAAQVNQSRAE